MSTVAVVVPFPEAAVLAAYWVVRRLAIQDEIQLALATSVLVEALRRGERVPPDTVDRLVLLAAGGRGSLEFQGRLVAALSSLQVGFQVDPCARRRP